MELKMQITEEIKRKIKEDALKDIAKECCGLILENGRVIPCENRAEDNNVHFIIANGDIKKAQKQGWISAVYHSHVPGDYEDDYLSPEDIVIAEYFNVFSIMYSIKYDKFYEYQPTGKPIGYTGRPYIRGILDEFHLVRDYYKRELNIEIKDLKNRNIESFLTNNGFIETNGVQKHNILIIKWSGNIEKRKMVLYVDENKIIAHPDFELSEKLDYNYGLKKWTEKIFKHSKL